MPYVQRHCAAHHLDMHAHLRLLLAHGICHLLGYRHETDAEEAEVIFFLLGKADPHPPTPPKHLWLFWVAGPGRTRWFAKRT